jgi:hypothetical protein
MSTPDEVALSAAVQAVMNEGYDQDEAQIIARAAVSAYQSKMLEMMDADAGEADVAGRPAVPPNAARAWSSESDDDIEADG